MTAAPFAPGSSTTTPRTRSIACWRLYPPSDPRRDEVPRPRDRRRGARDRARRHALQSRTDELRTVPECRDAPLHGDVDSEEIMEHYGELKAMCERVAQQRQGAIVRPGLIVGPHDPTGRFTYWPHRIARGGDVLAPGPPDEAVTLIDVRDLGEWIVRLCENATHGIFNAIDVTTWGELLDACVRATGSDARLVWVPSEWLVEKGVGEWMELPLWVSSEEMAGLHRVGNERAVSAGLTFRSLEETARATLADAETTDDAGLKPEREAELLAEWAALQSLT